MAKGNPPINPVNAVVGLHNLLLANLADVYVRHTAEQFADSVYGHDFYFFHCLSNFHRTMKIPIIVKNIKRFRSNRIFH